MRVTVIVTVWFVFYFATGKVCAQEKTQKATVAISVNDFGEQKNFHAFVQDFKSKTGFNVLACCEHLNLMICEYDASIFRDQLAVITFLKAKRFLFEVREGFTAENMEGVCKQAIHKE